METNIENHLNDDTLDPQPWEGLSTEDYLRHLSYDCDTCVGKRG